jgi:hypothetical protein
MKGRKPHPDPLPVIALAAGKDPNVTDPDVVASRSLVVAAPRTGMPLPPGSGWFRS